MGLRFRKSITLCKGVKLNFGKTGASVSVGVPGLHKTFHTSGRQTTSIGMPGTGLSYVDVDTSRVNGEQTQRNQRRATQPVEVPHQQEPYAPPIPAPILSPQPRQGTRRIDRNTITEIHTVADEPIDWTEALLNAEPSDGICSIEKWRYFHTVAESVLDGDINTYLHVVRDVNPYDDLLDYGGDFIFGTDDASKMEVEFTTKSQECMPSKSCMSTEDYNNLFCSYICSCTLRVARDTFALLPVQIVIIHVVDIGKTVLSIVFDRGGVERLRFRFANPIEVIKLFQHNMVFDHYHGFSEVKRLE